MFQVEWIDPALDELAIIWMAADSQSRQLITQATYLLDQELQHNPLEQGESRDAEDRIFFVYPLGVQFTVLEDVAKVRVWHVWDIRRRQ